MLSTNQVTKIITVSLADLKVQSTNLKYSIINSAMKKSEVNTETKGKNGEVSSFLRIWNSKATKEFKMETSAYTTAKNRAKSNKGNEVKGKVKNDLQLMVDAFVKINPSQKTLDNALKNFKMNYENNLS